TINPNNRMSNIAVEAAMLIMRADFAAGGRAQHPSAGSCSSGGKPVMSDTNIYRVQPSWQRSGTLDNETYLRWYAESVRDPDAFWGEHGRRIDWFRPYTVVKNASFEGEVSIRWFEDGELNVSYNCIDRHLDKRGDQVAILWEGDDPAE